MVSSNYYIQTRKGKKVKVRKNRSGRKTIDNVDVYTGKSLKTGETDYEKVDYKTQAKIKDYWDVQLSKEFQKSKRSQFSNFSSGTYNRKSKTGKVHIASVAVPVVVVGGASLYANRNS